MAAKANAPVIIKRKKSGGGGGHHGGAWKVAYADFVTAMMAFFLLMWLLNATTEKQRKGIADYFNPTVPINRVSGGGDGAFGGDSVFSEQTLAQSGTGASQERPTESDAARGTVGSTADGQDGQDGEAELFEAIEEALTARSGESMVSELIARHIVTRVTDEGLVVEIFDAEGAPLFDGDTDQPTAILTLLVNVVAGVFQAVTNDVAVNGHVRAYPEPMAASPVWDLSQDRANRLRGMLDLAGFAESRVRRVSGFADREPVTVNPFAVRNNRVELILLRSKS
jgi:chemotaxis protein MotB